MQVEKDARLWEVAKRRMSFKYHLGSYIIMNIFFWVIWFLTGTHANYNGGLPWPVWPALGWGVGLLFHFLGAYIFVQESGIEKEYEKLTRHKN